MSVAPCCRALLCTLTDAPISRWHLALIITSGLGINALVVGTCAYACVCAGVHCDVVMLRGFDEVWMRSAAGLPGEGDGRVARQRSASSDQFDKDGPTSAQPHTLSTKHPPDRVMIGTKRVESGRLRILEPASTYFGRHT